MCAHECVHKYVRISVSVTVSVTVSVWGEIHILYTGYVCVLCCVSVSRDVCS